MSGKKKKSKKVKEKKPAKKQAKKPQTKKPQKKSEKKPSKKSKNTFKSNLKMFQTGNEIPSTSKKPKKLNNSNTLRVASKKTKTKKGYKLPFIKRMVSRDTLDIKKRPKSARKKNKSKAKKSKAKKPKKNTSKKKTNISSKMALFQFQPETNKSKKPKVFKFQIKNLDNKSKSKSYSTEDMIHVSTTTNIKLKDSKTMANTEANANIDDDEIPDFLEKRISVSLAFAKSQSIKSRAAAYSMSHADIENKHTKKIKSMKDKRDLRKVKTSEARKSIISLMLEKSIAKTKVRNIGSQMNESDIDWRENFNISDFISDVKKPEPLKKRKRFKKNKNLEKNVSHSLTIVDLLQNEDEKQNLQKMLAVEEDSADDGKNEAEDDIKVGEEIARNVSIAQVLNLNNDPTLNSNLSDIQMSKICEVVCEAIVNNPQLTQLQMCNANISDEFFIQILNTVLDIDEDGSDSENDSDEDEDDGRKYHLNELWFESNAISDEGMEELADFLAKDRNIRVIKLANNKKIISTQVLNKMLNGLEINHKIIKFEFKGFRFIHQKDRLAKYLKRNQEIERKKKRMNRMTK